MASSRRSEGIGALLGTADGGVCAVVPITDKTYRRLQLLQQILANALTHAAGLNPRAWRSARRPLHEPMEMQRAYLKRKRARGKSRKAVAAAAAAAEAASAKAVARAKKENADAMEEQLKEMQRELDAKIAKHAANPRNRSRPFKGAGALADATKAAGQARQEALKAAEAAKGKAAEVRIVVWDES